MSESNVGGVDYKIHISGDVSAFTKTMDNVEKAFANLDKSVNQMSQKMDKAFGSLQNSAKSLDSAVKTFAKTSSTSMNTAAKSSETLAKTNEKLARTADDAAKGQANNARQSTQMMKMMEAASRQVERLSTSYSNMGASGEKFIKPLSQALQEYQKNLKAANGDTASITTSQELFKNAVHGVQMEMSRYKAELQHTSTIKKDYNAQSAEAEKALKAEQAAMREQEKIAVKMANSIAQAERETSALAVQMKALGATNDQITPLTQAMDRYRIAVREAGGDQTKVAAANNEYKASMQNVKNEVTLTGKTLGKFGDQNKMVEQSLHNTTKAIQLALGPLSGIAARVTAFTSLMKANTIAIASFVSSITALVVATGMVIREGIEYERQMLSMAAAVESSGYAAETTAGQINALAEGIAEATLSGTRETRQAAQLLLNYRNLSVGAFDDILMAAQGMSSMMGTNLVAATRMLGRALEDPASNLDALRRVNIQFTDSEKMKIQVLQNSGRMMEAQNVIMSRFNVAQNLAAKEAKGLAGALDTMRERMLKLREQTAVYAQTNENLAAAVNQVSEVFDKLLKDGNRIEPLMDAVAGATRAVAATISFLSNNINALVLIIGVGFVASMVRAGAALVGWLFQFGKLKVAAAAGTGVIGTLATRFAFLGGTMKAVGAIAGTLSIAGPIIAGAAAGLMLLDSFQQADKAVNKLKKNINLLDENSERNVKMQALQQKALNGIGKAAEDAAKELKEMAEMDFSRLNSTLKDFATQNFFDNTALEDFKLFGKEIFFAIVTPVEGIPDMINTIMDRVDIINQGEAIRQQFEGVFTTIQSGGYVSRDAIVELQSALGDSEVDVRKIVTRMMELRHQTKSAESVVKNLASGLDAAGRAFNIDALIEGLEKSGLREVITGVTDDIEELQTAVSIAQLDNASAAETAARMYDTQKAAIISTYEATDKGSAATEEYARQMSMLGVAINVAKDRLQNLDTIVESMANSEFNDFLSEVEQKLRIIGSSNPLAEIAKIDDENAIKKLAEDAGLLSVDLLKVNDNMLAIYNTMSDEQKGAFADIEGFDGRNFLTLATNMATAKATAVEFAAVLFGFTKQADRDIEGVIETTKDLENAFALAGASGSTAFQNMIDAQSLQSDIDDIVESLKDFNSEELEKLAKMYGITADGADELRKAIAKAAASANKAVDDNEELAKVFEKSVENMDEFTASLKDAENQYKALVKGGVEGLEKALLKQKGAEKIKEMVKQWNELTKAQDRNVLITKLQEQVGNAVVVTHKNYLEVLQQLAEQITATEKATEDYQKSLEDLADGINEVLEEAELLNAEFEALSKGLGADFAQDVVKAKELAAAFEAAGRPIAELQRLNGVFPDLFKDAQNFEADMVEMLSQQRIQKQWLDDWQAATEEFEGIARDGFHAIFTDGIDGFKDMVRSFKDMFKKMLLDMIYEAAIKPIMVQVAAAVTGMFNPMGGGQGGTGGLSSALSMASMGKSLMGGVSSIGSATTQLLSTIGGFNSALSSVTTNLTVGLGNQGIAVSNALGLQNTTASFEIGAGALTTAFAGMAGAWGGAKVMDELGGKQAGSNWGAAAGAALGSFIPVLGTALGAFLGGALGSVFDSLFGSKKSERTEYAGGRLSDDMADIQYADKLRSQKNRDLATDIFGSFKLIAESLGGSDAVMSVRAQEYGGVALQVGDSYKKFKDMDKFYEEAFDQILEGATKISPAVKEMMKSVEGSIEEMIGTTLMLEEAYSKVPIDLDAVRSMQQHGEELVDTFVRVATNLAGVNDAFTMLNIPLLTMDGTGARVADTLVNLFGGVDALSESMSTYYNLFFSEEERMQATMGQLTGIFEQLGVALPDTNEAFRELVESLDLTTDSGQETFASLMKIAPAFDEIMTKQQELIVAEKERLDEALDAQRQVMDEMMSAAGISADAIGTILRDGLLHRMTAEDVGAQLVETVIGGVYNSLASTYANQISSIMMSGIVEPMVTAAATGASISAAVSQAAIDTMIAQATAAANALGAILNDPQFKAAIAQVTGALNQVGVIIAPRYIDPPTPPDIPEYTRNVERATDALGEFEKATNASLDALKKYVAEERRRIEDRMSSLEDAANNFMDGFERNIDEQANALESSHDELMNNLEAAIDPVKASIQELDRNANSLRKTIDSMKSAMTDPAMARDSAMSTMRGFLGGGITNQDAFDKSLATIANNDQKYYSSFQDYAIDQYRAQSLLDTLLKETEGQLSIEEQTLNTLESQMAQAETNHEAQIALLEAQLQAGQDAIDSMMGIDNSLYELVDVMSAVAAYQEYQTEALARLNELDAILSNAERQLDQLRGINVGITDVATAVSAFTAAFAAEAKFRGVNIPAFASGGSHSGGVRLVGENGPEIEATGASRIFSARQSASQLLDTTALVEKLNEVVAELEQIKEGNVQLVKNSGRSLDYTRRWDNRGLPPTRTS